MPSEEGHVIECSGAAMRAIEASKMTGGEPGFWADVEQSLET